MQALRMLRIGTSAAALLGVGILSGCAAQETLSPKIAAVEQNIGTAREKGADVYAPEALQSAEDKLSEARSAVQADQLVNASKLLDEAMSDAQFAQIKAPTVKAKKEVAALLADIKVLRAEVDRLVAAD